MVTCGLHNITDVILGIRYATDTRDQPNFRRENLGRFAWNDGFFRSRSKWIWPACLKLLGKMTSLDRRISRSYDLTTSFYPVSIASCPLMQMEHYIVLSDIVVLYQGIILSRSDIAPNSQCHLTALCSFQGFRRKKNYSSNLTYLQPLSLFCFSFSISGMPTLVSYWQFFTQIQRPFRVQHRFQTREMTMESSPSIPQIRSVPELGAEGPAFKKQRLEANDESDTRALVHTAVQIEVEEEIAVRMDSSSANSISKAKKSKKKRKDPPLPEPCYGCYDLISIYVYMRLRLH